MIKIILKLEIKNYKFLLKITDNNLLIFRFKLSNKQI